MPTKYEVGEDKLVKGEIYKVYPENIVVDPKENGRVYGVDVTDLVVKYLAIGRWIHPIECRPIEENKLKVTAGYRRLGASIFINKHIGDGELEKLAAKAGLTNPMIPVEPIRIPVQVVAQNAEEALVTNIIENKARRGVSDVDAAENIHRLMTQYNWDEDRILALYGEGGKPKSRGWLTQTLKIRKLSAKAKKMMHDGFFKANVAYYVADLPEDERDEVLEIAKGLAEDETGKKDAPITMKEVVKAAKTKNVAKKLQKKMNDVIDLFTENQPVMPASAKKFAEAFMSWVYNGLDDAKMAKEFSKRFIPDQPTGTDEGKKTATEKPVAVEQPTTKKSKTKAAKAAPQTTKQPEEAVA
jgi:ParB-like chromosome segregation protein Spo0J